MNTMMQIRKKRPLIHHLTNQVVMNFTANGLLSFGGSPIMAKETREMQDMAGIADGVLINIGTLTEKELEAMGLAGMTANERGIPVVLDPVGVAASSFRTQAVNTLLGKIQFTAIKGNAGEMAHLVGARLKTKGVESEDGDESELVEIARKAAKRYDTIAIVTGKTDIICWQDEVKFNQTGHVLLTNITGAGCLLGSLITAALTTNINPIEAVYEVVAFYGNAAEKAMAHPSVNGTGSFIPIFLDQLAG
jgi:hydroxyethylthiazole kinase